MFVKDAIITSEPRPFPLLGGPIPDASQVGLRQSLNQVGCGLIGMGPSWNWLTKISYLSNWLHTILISVHATTSTDACARRTLWRPRSCLSRWEWISSDQNCGSRWENKRRWLKTKAAMLSPVRRDRVTLNPTSMLQLTAQVEAVERIRSFADASPIDHTIQACLQI